MRSRGVGWRWVLVTGVLLMVAFGCLTGIPSEAWAGWTRPQLVCGAHCGGALSGALAENPRGDAVAAWIDYHSSKLEIAVAPRGRRFGAVRAFKGPESIADDGVGAAIDARGHVIVAAFEGAQAESGSTPLDGVVVVRGTVRGSWSRPEQVSLPGEQPTRGGHHAGPAVAIRRGESAVGWTAVDWGAQASSVRVAEASWGRPFGLPGEPARVPDASLAGLTVDSGGRVDVAWTQATAVVAQAFEAIGRSGRFGTPGPILASPPRGPFSAEVAFDATGRARLILAGSAGGLGGPLDAALYSPGGSPVARQRLGVGGPDRAALAVAGDGDALAAWADGGIRVAVASPGGAFGTPRRVSRAAGFDPSVAVAASDTGRGVAIFDFDTQNGGSVSPGPAVAAISLDAPGRPGRVHVLDAGGAGAAFAGVDGHGRATVMWTDGTGLHAERER